MAQPQPDRIGLNRVHRTLGDMKSSIRYVIVGYAQAKYDLSDLCCFCCEFINRFDWYFTSSSGKLAHYLCGREGGWRKKKKVKKVSGANSAKPVENLARLVRIVRGGKIIK